MSADFTEVSSAGIPRSPVVSVVMVTYNHERFIGQAIEGVVKQETSFPIELVIGEDCSTDGTRGIVLDWQRRYPHLIRVVLQNRNRGAAANVRAVLGCSRGTYVAQLEGDDYWTDTAKLQSQVDALMAQPEAALCGARAYVWRDGDDAPSEIQPSDPLETLMASGARGMFEGQWWLRTCTKMIRRDMLTRVPPHLSGDWTSTLWILAKTGLAPVCFVDRIVGVYRLHAGGAWSALSEQQRCLIDVRSIADLIPWLTGRERAHMMSELQSRLDELATRGTPAAVRLRAAQGLLAAEPFAFWRWRLARPLLRPQRD